MRSKGGATALPVWLFPSYLVCRFRVNSLIVILLYSVTEMDKAILGNLVCYGAPPWCIISLVGDAFHPSSRLDIWRVGSHLWWLGLLSHHTVTSPSSTNWKQRWLFSGLPWCLSVSSAQQVSVEVGENKLCSHHHAGWRDSDPSEWVRGMVFSSLWPPCHV